MKQFFLRLSGACAGWLLGGLFFIAIGSTWADEPLARLEAFNQRMHKEVFEGPKEVRLFGGVKGQSVVLRQTRWELKNQPQSSMLGERMRRDAMDLPETERLASMNRIDDDIQMWFVRVTDLTNSGAALKSDLPTGVQGNEHHCEAAFLGISEGWAWFGFMPIYEWIILQKELNLQNGDDPLEAAVRGLSIEDRGSMTANSVEGILVGAGAGAIPYITPLLLSTSYSRALRVLGQIPGRESTALLLQSADSTNQNLASAARHYTIVWPRPDAEERYFRWLDEDAGRTNVLSLLQACAEINKPRLAPLLPRLLEAPQSVREFRFAFEVSRSVEGKAIPDHLLQAENSIKTHGYRSGPNFDQQKVDEAVAELVRDADVEAAACIGLSLALATTKGDWRPANEAGCAVLKGLPDQRGTKLAQRLVNASQDQDVKRRLQSVVGN